MDLQNLKNQIKEAGFSEESLNYLNSILDGAIARGNLLEEEKKQLTEIIDEEMAQAEKQADAMEEISLALDSYAHNIDQIVDLADRKTKALEENISQQIDDLEQQKAKTTQPQTVPSSQPPLNVAQ